MKCIDNELPLAIPENWAWVRLENIVNILDNQRMPVSLSERETRILGKKENELYPYFGATGVTGYIDDYLFDGDFILLGEDGAPFLDKFAIKAYKIHGKSWVNNHAHILKSFIFDDYLLSVLNAVNYTTYVHGTTRLKLTQADMCNILIPIPPQSEQKLIIERINNMFNLSTRIEASLN